jgi:hypothetical protein
MGLFLFKWTTFLPERPSTLTLRPGAHLIPIILLPGKTSCTSSLLLLEISYQAGARTWSLYLSPILPSLGRPEAGDLPSNYLPLSTNHLALEEQLKRGAHNYYILSESEQHHDAQDEPEQEGFGVAGQLLRGGAGGHYWQLQGRSLGFGLGLIVGCAGYGLMLLGGSSSVSSASA